MFTKTLIALASAALVVSALAPAHAAHNPNGTGDNGMSINGTTPNGGGLNGGGINGIELNGGGENGTSPNGGGINGIAQGTSGFAIDSIELPAAR